MLPSLKDIRSIPDEDIIRRHDEHRQENPTEAAIATYYRAELERRDQAKQTERMLELTSQMHEFTKQVRGMTRWILAATIISTIAVIVSLLKDLLE